MFRISPKEMILLAIAQEQIAFKEGNEHIIISPFSTKKGEKTEAVGIVKLFWEARHLLTPYDEPEEWNIEAQAKAVMGLSFFFSTLIDGYISGKDFTWPNFLEEVTRDDPEALDALELIVGHHSLMQGTKFVPTSKFGENKRFPRACLNYLEGESERPVRLPVPDNILDSVLDAVEQIYRESDIAHKEINETIEWFAQHREDFAFIEKSMWEDITSRPMYGLRSNGKDIVKLEILSCDHCVSYKTIQFFPSEFPNAKAKVWSLWRGKQGSVVYELTPNYSASTEDNLPYSNYVKLIDELVRFAALQCYWEIVMGKSSQSAPVSPEAKKKASTEDREKMKEKLSHVRPFFRKLPEGHKSSEKALMLAQQTFSITSMPPGRTFVREHERGWQEMETLTPLFTYSIQDIKSWIQ